MKSGFHSILVTSIWRGEDVPDLLPNGFECWWRDQRLRHVPGGYSDGLSSPQFLHLDEDVDSRDWAYPAAVIHDGGYHDDLEIFKSDITDSASSGYWEKFPISKDDTDVMFKELMETLATSVVQMTQAIVFYEAVHLFGQKAFDAGRAAHRSIPTTTNT